MKETKIKKNIKSSKITDYLQSKQHGLKLTSQISKVAGYKVASQKGETIQIFIEQRMNKQNILYPYNRMQVII